MTPSMNLDCDTLIAGAASLQPVLAESARHIDQHGQTDESLARLEAAGLLRHADTISPADLFRMRMEVGRQLAHGCASSAWLVTAFGLGAALAARIPAAQRPGLEARIAIGDDAADTTLAIDGDKRRLSGRWDFVAGAAFADWFLLSCETAPARCLVLVARDQVAVSPAEHAGGLRGAGIATVTASGVAVPAAAVFDRVQLAEGFELIATASILGPILGCAEAGYRDYVAITRKRVSGVGGEAVARMTQVQARLGAAQAELKSAQLNFAALQDSIAAIEAGGGTPGASATTELLRDAAFIARQCLQSLTALVRQMGAMGLAESNPVQREYRDLRTMVADRRLQESTRMAAYGRQALGIEEAGSRGDRAA
jgi:alkylation response protein AidB-like acyl-CoA dehydrogenase